MQSLQTMVNYNAKTVKGMALYASNRVNFPTSPELSCVEWNLNTNFIAVGGSTSMLKIVKFADTPLSKNSGKPMTNLQANQLMEGHVGTVNCLSWNEVHQKLTSSDANGLIIVWNLHNETWYEEMINNRNKSFVVCMSWCADGSKIAIAYQDGQVIVGTNDGNRIWNKELPHHLSQVDWSPNGEILLFGLQDGEVHLYDSQGIFIQKVNVPALENVDLTAALDQAEHLRKAQLIALKWWHPTHKSRLIDQTTTIAVPEDGRRGRLGKAPSLEFLIQLDQEEVKQPQILIAYAHGAMQIMTSESDPYPITITLENFMMTCARWSPNGAFIATCGYKTDVGYTERCCVQMVSANGEKLAMLRVPGRTLTGLSWDPTGLRLVLAADSALLLTNIRPYYKWGYCGDTVIFAYERPEKRDFRIIFYETKLEEPYPKAIPNLLHIASFDKYCILVNKPNPQPDMRGAERERADGRYYLQLCNSIGTPVDYKYVDIEPKCVGMNGKVAVIADTDSFVIWHFNLPKPSSISVPPLRHLGSNDVQVQEVASMEFASGKKKRASDPFCAVAFAQNFFIIVSEEGAAFRVGFDGVIVAKFTLPAGIIQMELNCTYQRLATLDNTNTLQFFDLKEETAEKITSMPVAPSTSGGKVVQPPSMDKKDVWSFKWDVDREECIAFSEKGRMMVQNGAEIEDGVNNIGFIARFKDLTVRTVALDRFLLEPEKPQKSFISDIEVKLLRDAKNMLTKHPNHPLDQLSVKIIEQGNHRRLWELLSEVALTKLDLEKAEHAFVKLEDYCGLQFCKRVACIKDDKVKRAECDAFLGRFEEAEKGFRACDRGELALEMYVTNEEWGKALAMLNKGYGGHGTDQVKTHANEMVGDQYYERQKWREAVEYYEKARCPEKLVQCYLKLDDYEALMKLAKNLEVGKEELLSELGFLFGSAGLCDESVDCYIRCGKVKDALDVCIQLNQWAKAEAVAKGNNLKDVDGLLEKHTSRLKGSTEQSMAAVQLYRRAGRFLDAAKIVYNIANDERMKNSPCLRLKKLYVMGALLIEEYHTSKRNKLAEERGKDATDASVALTGLLQEDEGVTIEQSRMIDGAWRGALAFHFYMMAHRQLYDGHLDSAMKTAMAVTDYEDIIDPLDIYTLLALASAANRQFAICSRAFMKLERLETDSQQQFKDLAIKIFTAFPPINTKANLVPCVNCEAMIPDHSQYCPECESKFPICVATGKPLIDFQFWLCPCCHHRAYEQYMTQATFCPLCHHGLS